MRHVCQGCRERWVTETSRCHESCGRYRAEREARQAAWEAARRARAAEADADGFRLDAAERTKRRKRR